MKLSGIKYLADQGVENIWKNKMMAFATFCVLLISLLLVGIAGLFYINLNSMIKGLGSQNEVVVIMNVGTTEEQNSAAEAAIKELPNIDKVTFISKEDALSRQKANLPNAEKIFDEYIGTDASFMPDGFSALAVVSMIIISNTTKASVFARREEIQIMKYVGATNAFIRMPFFVEGMVTGLFAGAGAYFITWAVYRAVYNMITEQGMLMNTFGVKSLIPFSDIRLPLALAYLVFGALIGALGSVVSTRKHIDV